MKDRVAGVLNDLLRVVVGLTNGFRRSMKFLEAVAEVTLI